MSGSGFAPQFQQQQQYEQKHKSQIVVKPIAKMSEEAIFRKSFERKIMKQFSEFEASQNYYAQMYGERFEIDGSDESASIVSHASHKTFTHVGHQMAASLASGPQTPMTSTSPMSPSTSPGMPASTFFYPQDPQAMQQQAMQQAMQQFQHQQAMQHQQQVILEQQQIMRQQQPPAFQPIQQQLAAAAAPFHFPAAAPKPYAAAAAAAAAAPLVAASQKAAPKPSAQPIAKPSAAAMEAAIVDGSYARGGGGGGGGGGSFDSAPQAFMGPSVMGKGKGLSKAERDAVNIKRQIELASEQVKSCPEAKAWIDKIASFIRDCNEWKMLADLGQSSNGLAKPAACAALKPALKLKDALMSDERFVVKGDSVGLFEWSQEGEGEAEAEAEAEAENNAAGDLSEGADVAQQAQEEAEEAEEVADSRKVFYGRIYFKSDTFAFISFPAEKDEAHQALFTGMCDWLKAQKEKGKKKASVMAFKMIGSEKFGQNLIAYKNESNSDVFDSLKQLDKIVFYINEMVDNDGEKCFQAVEIIPAE